MLMKLSRVRGPEGKPPGCHSKILMLGRYYPRQISIIVLIVAVVAIKSQVPLFLLLLDVYLINGSLALRKYEGQEITQKHVSEKHMQ